MTGFLVMLLFGCASTNQLHTTTQTLAIDLEPRVLKTAGIAFITPSSATGQEEDKQALALSFTEALKKARPDLRVVPLPETLGAINRAGLASEYRQMFEDYRLSGIFHRETLAKGFSVDRRSLSGPTQTRRISAGSEKPLGRIRNPHAGNKDHLVKALSSDMGR